MSDRITRKFCEGQLQRIAAMSGRPLAGMYPHKPGGLLLQEESGVKRLCVIPDDGRGVSDRGLPGCLTWRELSVLLRGIEEGLTLRETA